MHQLERTVKTHKPVLAVLLAIIIVGAMSAVILQPAYAQICTDPTTGQVGPCKPPREKKTKVPTPVPPSRTPTPTPTPTATPAGLPLTGGAAGPAQPAINPSPAAQLYKFSNTTFLGGLGILLLLLFLAALLRGRRSRAFVGRNDGKLQMLGSAHQGERGPNSVSSMNYRYQLTGIQHGPDASGPSELASQDSAGHASQPLATVSLTGGGTDPDASGLSELTGNDQTVGMQQPKAYLARNDGRVQMNTGSGEHELGHNSSLDHGGPNEEGGTEAADQGDSSSMRKPPDSA
jgi:hypothetical protein